MRLYFSRHGESEANTRGIISNRNLPHPLTSKGRLQAVALAERFRAKPITRIYSSPIPRARETAEILSETLLVPVDCVDALREPDCGVLEGRGDEAAWAEHNYWRECWLNGCNQDRAPIGGETCEDLRNRLAIFISTLVTRFGESESEFLLVTHGALILHGLPGILANVDSGFFLERSLGYTVLISVELQKGKLICIGWE